MLYTVSIWFRGQLFAREQAWGYDQAAEIEAFYPVAQGYEVDIEPNVYGYIDRCTAYQCKDTH